MSPHATYSAGDAPGHLEHLTREIGTEKYVMPNKQARPSRSEVNIAPLPRALNALVAREMPHPAAGLKFLLEKLGRAPSGVFCTPVGGISCSTQAQRCLGLDALLAIVLYFGCALGALV